MNTHRHPRTQVLALVTLALAASACAGGTRSTSSPGAAAASVGQQRWTANLTPRNGTTVAGSATLVPTPENRTRVSISVQGASPNINLPWHLHTGVCGAGGPVFGSGGSYPMLGTSGEGRAGLQVDLQMAPPTAGSHHIDVHAGPGSDAVVACGDLRPASGEN